MELIVKMSSLELLDEFRNFSYTKDPDFVLFEEYDHSPGFQKEPIVIAIIVALGGPKILNSFQNMLKDFLDFQLKKNQVNSTAKLELDRQEKEFLLKQENLRLEYAKRFVELELKHNEKIQRVSFDDIIDVDYEDITNDYM